MVNYSFFSFLNLISSYSTRLCAPSGSKPYGTWISFCFWATDLGSEKLSSEKNLSSVTLCTVGKLSSVGVHVTSTVLTEFGIHEPTSFYKPGALRIRIEIVLPLPPKMG